MSASPEKQLQVPSQPQQDVSPTTTDSGVSLSLSNSTSISTPSVSSSTVAADPLTCQWGSCRERCTNPEALYDHVCERHVGRKSTNNLNLTCQWGNCRTTTVKRDHITSHIRVHVPLKPHKCEFCGKSFKRPQDLKKHVKTHADESVILRSPEPTVPSQKSSMMPQVYQHTTSRPSNYHYDTHSHMSGGSYGYPQAATGHGHYGQSITTSGYNPSYGPVYYNIPQTNGYSTGMTDSRKRGFEDLNDFFGDVKRRQVDGSQYHDLGRFSSLVGAGSGGTTMSSFQAGYHAGLRAANGGGSMLDDNMGGGATTYQTATHAPSMSSHYGMPFTELKTKSDLLTIDHFLEQLQHTVYEHPDQTTSSLQAMSELQLPVVVGNHHRVSGSPQQMMNYSSSASVSTPDAYPGPSASFGRASIASAFDDNTSTPALTPSSYAAASHSPASSQTNISPIPHSVHAHMPASAQLYPTLPSLSSISPDAQGLNGSAAPLSHLGSAYEDIDTRRRYSGGFLQRAQPANTRTSFPSSSLARGNASDADSTSPTESSKSADMSRCATNSSAGNASPSSRRSSIELSRTLRKVDLSSPENAPIKLPGIAEMTRGSGLRRNSEEEDEKQEMWIRNMRVIEDLLKYVRGRLESGDYVGDDAAAKEDRDVKMSEGSDDVVAGKKSESLYPVLRTVEAKS